MNVLPMEREPDFEDDKVSVWRGELPGVDPQNDPTILRVDVEHEEPYESRVYGPKLDDESIAQLIRVVTSSELGRPLPILGTVLLVHQFLEDGVVKLLSKRMMESGEISLLVVGSMMGRRFLLRPERTLTEEAYRRKVVNFERRWVEGGPLTLGQVIGPEEWERYREH